MQKKLGIGLLLLFTSLKAVAINKIMECHEAQQTPANLTVVVSVRDEKTVQLQSFKQNGGQAGPVKEIADIVTPKGSQVVKAAYAAAGGSQARLSVSNKPGKSSEGDEGLLGSYSDNLVSKMDVVCWLSKIVRQDSASHN